MEVCMAGPDAATVRATSVAPARAHTPDGCAPGAGPPRPATCVSRVNGVTVQDVIVDVPAELQDDDGLRTSLIQMLQDS
jgi:hypothetical protein